MSEGEQEGSYMAEEIFPLTPTPLPTGEELVFPSPPGRGWPAGPGEGADKQADRGHGPICITPPRRGSGNAFPRLRNTGGYSSRGSEGSP